MNPQSRDLPRTRRRAAQHRVDTLPYSRKNHTTDVQNHRNTSINTQEENFNENDDGNSWSSSILSRVFSYIPIVGKYMADDVEEVQPIEHSNTTPENTKKPTIDDIHDEYMGQTSTDTLDLSSPTEKMYKEMENKEKQINKHKINHKAKIRSPLVGPLPTNETPVGQTRSTTESKDINPRVERTTRRKRALDKAFVPTRKTKVLKIDSSPSNEQHINKTRRKISLNEFGRISHRLQQIATPVPESALTLTYNTLESALTEKNNTDIQTSVDNTNMTSSTYVPGSITARARGEAPLKKIDLGSILQTREESQENNAIIQSTLNDNKPIYLNLYWDEKKAERIRRRPSKIATREMKWPGFKQRIDTQALAMRVNATLRKMEEQKQADEKLVAPSRVTSWAQYHLSAPVEPEINIEKVDEEFPQPYRFSMFYPDASINTESSKKTEITSQNNAIVQSTTTSEEAKTSITNDVQKQKLGTYSFTLPQKMHLNKDVGDNSDILYVFAQPPSLRQVPKSSNVKKNSSQKETPFSFMPQSPKSRAEGLDESLVKKSTPSKNETQKVSNNVASTAAVEVKTVEPTPAQPTVEGYNPLARFLKMAPGSWRCPTCSVTNEAKYSKCPCCETCKPGSTKKSESELSSNQAEIGGAITSAGFSFGSSTSKTSNDSTSNEKPVFSFGASTSKTSIDSASNEKPAFSFGVPSGTVTNTTGKTPAFSFGTPSGNVTSTSNNTASSSDTTVSKNTDISSNSFFGIPPSTTTTSSNGKTPSFSFGVAPKSTEEAITTAPPAFSFGATTTATPVSDSLKRKAEDIDSQTPPAKKAGTSSSGFSFGSALKDTSSSYTSAGSALTSGFSFESTRKYDDDTKSNTTTSQAQPKSFIFGSSSATASNGASFGQFQQNAEKLTTSTPTFGSAGGLTGNSIVGNSQSLSDANPSSTTKPAISFSSEKISPQSKPTFVLEDIDDPPNPPISAAKPSYTFGSNFSTPAVKATTEISSKTVQDTPKPSFTFGSSSKTFQPHGTSGQELNAKNSFETTPQPAYSFGSASSTPVAKPPTSKPTDDIPKPSYTFGSSMQNVNTWGSSAKEASGTKPTDSMSKPSFSFGSTPASTSQLSHSFGSNPSSALTAKPSNSTSTSAGETPKPSYTFGSSVPSFTPQGTSNTQSTDAKPSDSTHQPFTSFGNTTPSSSFGGSSGSTAFGSKTIAFGSNPTQNSTSAFGSLPTQNGTATFAPVAFGSSSSQTTTPAFGTSSTQSATPVFGSTRAQNPSLVFGSTSAQAVTPAFGTSSTQTTTPVFGSASNHNATRAFGSNSTQNIFGQSPAQNTAPNTMVFGQAAPTSTVPNPFSGSNGAGFAAPLSSTGNQTSNNLSGNASFNAAQEPAVNFNMGTAPTKRKILKANVRRKSRP